MEKAVVDRIVDGKHAVLLIGHEEEEKVIPYSELPNGVKEGTWLKIHDDGKELSFELDAAKTEETRDRIRSKMDLLRQRSKRNT